MLSTFVDGNKKIVDKMYTFINGQKKYIKCIYTFVNGQKKYILPPKPEILYINHTPGAFTFEKSALNYKYIEIEYVGACGNWNTISKNSGKGAKKRILLENPKSIKITNGIIGDSVSSKITAEWGIGGTGKSNGSNGNQLPNVSPASYAYGGGGSTGFSLAVNGGNPTDYEASAGGGNYYSRGNKYGANGGKGGGPNGGAGGTSSTGGGNATDATDGYNQFEYSGDGWIKITGYYIKP